MQDLNALSLPELFAALTADGSLDRLIDAALAEDAPEPGDITTASMWQADEPARAVMRTRAAGVVAGLAALESFRERDTDDPDAWLKLHVRDGRAVKAGTALATFTMGRAELLRLERPMLNLVGRLSGVATLTAAYVKAAGKTKSAVCDTRKTTPGLRNLEKYAVRCGGGTLHRIGLHDAALYKDNHLAGVPLKDLARVVGRAAERVRRTHDVRFVEVEVDSLAQLRELMKLPAGLIDIVLLDNMKPAMLRQAVELRNRHAPGLLLEASGGVTLKTIRAIARCGVDRISVGAITHSAPCLDVGLDFLPPPRASRRGRRRA